jgi:hypothetical protein
LLLGVLKSVKMDKHIEKMKKIEQLIKSLRKDGCSVFCVDNSSLVLEKPDTQIKNEKALKEEEKRNEKDRMLNGAYAGHFSPKCEYDYEISLS